VSASVIGMKNRVAFLLYAIAMCASRQRGAPGDWPRLDHARRSAIELIEGSAKCSLQPATSPLGNQMTVYDVCARCRRPAVAACRPRGGARGT